MKNAVRGEFTRLFSTRLPVWAIVAAVLSGAGLTGVLGIAGPENASPPMPGLDTPEGVAIAVGFTGLLLFVPALFGTVAITGEYRHKTIGTTFLAIPRRDTVLGAKLFVYTLFGLVYGLLMSLSSAFALWSVAAVRGIELGASAGDLAAILSRVAVAAAIYTVLGVGIGALVRSQLVAVGIVLGYFYFLEPVLMILPGLNTLYPYMPGGATAALTDFTFLTDTVAGEMSVGATTLLTPLLGALVLMVYAAVASAAAVVAPLRRDLV
jgi:ABC-2 type transport system permease protein